MRVSEYRGLGSSLGPPLDTMQMRRTIDNTKQERKTDFYVALCSFLPQTYRSFFHSEDLHALITQVFLK